MHISPQLVNPEIMSISNLILLHMLSIFLFSEKSASTTEVPISKVLLKDLLKLL